MNYRRALTTVALAATAFAGLATTSAQEANADVRVRIGGRAHVRVGGHVRVRPPHVRWRVRRPAPPPLRVHVGGAIWVGGGYYGPRFAPPPPPPVSCDCGPAYYHPVVPAASGSVLVAPARPQLPRWGIGVGAGGVNVEGADAGDDLALLARLRLTPRWQLEGEFGKSELADGARVDRRLGASALFEFSPYNRFTPYLVGGLGVTQVEVGDGAYETNQEFGELGVGLRYSLTRHIQIAGDIRVGSRSATGEAEPLDAAYRSVTPDEEESEEYTRARLSAVLFF